MCFFSGPPNISPRTYGVCSYYINVKSNTFCHEVVNQLFAKYISNVFDNNSVFITPYHFVKDEVCVIAHLLQ